VTPELTAHVLNQKYAIGLPLSRTNMANWAIGLGRDYFLPLTGR
jgi:hypothetical protein